MITKFTKGEWMIAENHIKDNHYQYSILANGSIMIADIMRHNFLKVGKSKFKDENTLYPCKEALANVKLIAAAPELLEILIKISNIENYTFTLKGFDVERLKLEVNTIIKKATNLSIED